MDLSENMEELTRSQRLDEGQLLVRTIIEMMGSPKEHLENTLKEYIKKLDEYNGADVIKHEIAQAKPIKDKEGMFITYAEIEIWFDDVERIVEFCFDYLPSSVEIIDPGDVKLKSNRLSGLLNDLQAKLHRLDTSLKNHIADKQAGSESFRIIMNNFIGYCIKTGKDKPEDIAKIVGIEKEKVEKLIGQSLKKHDSKA